MTELEIEKSLKHHEDIVDEIECLEKTLLKRRSELREADRLLAEAENELACTKEKVCLVCFRLGSCGTQAASCLKLESNDGKEHSVRAGHLSKSLRSADFTHLVCKFKLRMCGLLSVD